MSSHDKGHLETQFMDKLCNCSTKGVNWCFIHNTVKGVMDFNNGVNAQFGFISQASIPVPLFKPPVNLNRNNLLSWACDAHLLVAATGCPNYKVARVKVPTDLNIDNWRALCVNYHDKLLLEYLEYGFPLCVNRDAFVFNEHIVNHPSAVQFPDDIDTYFDKELQNRAIVGPCQDFPFQVHYSPILSRPKPDDTRRVIVNLSHPWGRAVNDHISNEVYDDVPYILKYPSVEDIVDAVDHLGGDVMLSKIDVSRAFRNLRVDPLDYDLLGLKWRGNSYLDVSVPMGMRTGSALCQRTTDVIRYVMASKGVIVRNYIDDVIAIHPRHQADQEFDTLYSLFEFLGVPINPKKVVPPTRVLTCMGICVDVDARQLTIPHEKILEIVDTCRLFLTRSYVTKRQLQSLLGRLLYIHRCVHAARIFVNRLLNNLRKATGRIVLNDEMKQDLSWFVQFLTKANGRVMFNDARNKLDVFVDASLSGMGLYWDNNVYAVSRHVLATQGLSITQLEFLNVLIAIRTFAKNWTGQCIRLHVDNKAVVYALQNARIRDSYMQQVARSIWLLLATYDIKVECTHIPGKDNVKADILSRVFERGVINDQLFHHCTWWPVNGCHFYPNVFI